MTDKKHSQLVSKRFLRAMRQVIADHDEGITNRSEFALRVGEYKQNLSKIEAGTRYPTIEVICNMCIAFGINPAWILLGRGEMKQASSVMNLGLLSKRLTEIEKLIQPEKRVRKKAN